MQLDINPLYGLSYEEIKQKLIRIIQTGELPNSWKDFYAGSTGAALTELLAAFSLLLSYETAKAREEAFITTASLESSILHAAATLGYPVNRESALEVQLKVATNPLDGVVHEPLERLISDYRIDLFPGSIDEDGRFREGLFVSPYFAEHEGVPLSISPISPDGGYRDYLLLIPRPAPNANRPDLQGFKNWDRLVLQAGTWKRMVVRGDRIIGEMSRRLIIRDSVDNNNLIVRIVDEYTDRPVLVKTTKYFEEVIPSSPLQDSRSLPLFEVTMPYGVVIFFDRRFGFPLSPNALVIIDYLSPYPYTGAFDVNKVNINHPNYQIKPDQGNFFPEVDPTPGEKFRVVSRYAQPDSSAKVKYTVLGYRASQRKAVTLNDYKYLFLSWRGDIVDAKAFGGRDPSGSVCCQITLSYVSVYFDLSGVPYPRYLSDSEKQEAYKYLSEKAVAGVTLRIVDPEYIDLPYVADVYVEPRLLGRVQEEVSRYFNSYIPMFDSGLTIGKITADLSKIPGIVRIYPRSEDPSNLGDLSVLVPRPSITYHLEE